MCGRFAFYSPAEATAALFGAGNAEPIESRYNIAPTQEIATIRHDADGKSENGCEYVCDKTSDDESCNNLDDNCDGQVDEGNPDGDAQCYDSENGCVESGGNYSCNGICVLGSIQCLHPEYRPGRRKSKQSNSDSGDRRMKDWFTTLQQREQIVVVAGAVVVLIAIFYSLVWEPLDSGHKDLSAAVTRWERSLAELKPLKGLQTSASGNAPVVSNASQQTPVVIVDLTLRARGLDRSLKRSQPTTSNGIRVEFDNVAFDELVLWLGDLSSQYAMQVTSGSMSTTAQSAPGRINATFTLERN